MTEIIEVEINGQLVYFEAESIFEEGWEKAGVDETVGKVIGSFEKALDTVQAVISSTVQRVRKFNEDIAPDEFQLQFGVKFSGEYGAVVTKVSGEAHLTVTATYKHPKTVSK